MLKAKEKGIEILSPQEWESSLEHKDVALRTIEKTICFTGEMPEKRSYYESIAKKNGFKPVDTVTKELSLLVTASKDSESSKVKKAKAAGIKIITLGEWQNSINGSKVKKEETPKEDEGFLPGLF